MVVFSSGEDNGKRTTHQTAMGGHTKNGGGGGSQCRGGNGGGRGRGHGCGRG